MQKSWSYYISINLPEGMCPILYALILNLDYGTSNQNGLDSLVYRKSQFWNYAWSVGDKTTWTYLGGLWATFSRETKCWEESKEQEGHRIPHTKIYIGKFKTVQKKTLSCPNNLTVQNTNMSWHSELFFSAIRALFLKMWFVFSGSMFSTRCSAAAQAWATMMELFHLKSHS